MHANKTTTVSGLSPRRDGPERKRPPSPDSRTTATKDVTIRDATSAATKCSLSQDSPWPRNTASNRETSRWPVQQKRTRTTNEEELAPKMNNKIPGAHHTQNMVSATGDQALHPHKEHMIPRDGFPPGYRVVSWDKELVANTPRHTVDSTTDARSARESDMTARNADKASARTARRLATKDRIDRTILGEFARSLGKEVAQAVRYLPSDIQQIFLNQLVGPDDFFRPGPDFIANILHIMSRPRSTPSAPPFQFGLTTADLERNSKLLASVDFDLSRLLPQYQHTTLGYGSEFRPVEELAVLLGKHPHFRFVRQILSSGMDYHYHEGRDLPEPNRLTEMAGQLQRGNHKSVAQDLEKVRELLSKDVSHGFTAPFPLECAPQIKGAMIQPLGVVKQWSLDENNNQVAKFRLTQDLSFSIDAEDHSVNGRVNLQRYPEMVYGWCLPRILHVVATLREQYPDRAIFICKYDYSDAYRRIAHSPTAAAQTIAILDDVAYVSLRLTFGGAPNPPTWCAVSELVTDLANEIVWCTEWNPTVARSSMMSEHITAKRVGSTVPFAQTRPMSIQIPSLESGRVDVFVDDVIHVFPDTPGALERYPHVVPLAMELTSRVHAGPWEPIPRRPILSPEKLAAEGSPAEIQQVLGWTIDTRRLTVSLPKKKFDMWTGDIKRIQKARRASTELLATIEGRLQHAASILPMARHFLTRLRKLKITTLNAKRPYAKLSEEVLEDLQLWLTILTITNRGVSINLLTTRRPDIVGWSDACPFGMGGYNTAGRAWRLLIDPKSPIFGESRVNNALEYIAMTVNAILSCQDIGDGNDFPCVLALGDNTSAIGWLYRSSRLSEPHHSIHLRVARHLAHEIIRNNCCLYSQHIPGSKNVVADLLSYDGQGRGKPHPIAHDQPDDVTLTRRFHESPTYSQQITHNFSISPLPPDINSWLQHTMRMLESFALVSLNKPSSPPIDLGDAGVGTVARSEAPMTRHWTECRQPHDNSLEKPSSNVSDSPVGTVQGTHSLIASVRERYHHGLSAKPSASWQRRVGSVNGRAPSTTRIHPTPYFPMLNNSYTPLQNGILRRRNSVQSHPNF